MKLSPETLSMPRPQRGQLSLPLPEPPRSKPPNPNVCSKCTTECDYCKDFNPLGR